METPEFCGSCHVMRPQRIAYESSPHRGVECAECHVAPGLQGVAVAKIRGLAQALALVTTTYARPIAPPEHGAARQVIVDNCVRCHRRYADDEDRIVTRRPFAEDEQNTEREVSLVVRLAGRAGERRGVHWHVLQKVEFVPRGERGEVVDYVRVTSPSEEVRSFLSEDTAYSQPRRDAINTAIRSGELERMTCITCHNRVGHAFRSPSRAVNEALHRGDIDRDLPFVKREATRLLGAPYASTGEARAAMEGLSAYYRDTYPATAVTKATEIAHAVETLREFYPLTADPELGVSFRAYPSFLGHVDSGGCFRCHDGKHRGVTASGDLTGVVVPASCATCHSPPRLGSRPEDLSTHPSGILFDHATAIRQAGGPATCAACHQRPSCDRCHERDVLLSPPEVGP